MASKKTSCIGLEWLLLEMLCMNVYRSASWLASLVVFSSLLVTLSTEAQNTYCVRAGATGSNNGSDWNNAYTDLPSSLVRGATYYVAAGSYKSHNFNDAQSGTSLIVVKKATTTDYFTVTGWQSSYGTGQAVFAAPFTFNKGYYTIDGQSRTTINSGHGIHLVNGGSQPINVSVGSTAPSYAPNVTVRYVEIEGSHSHGDSPVDVGVLVDNTQASSHGGDNLLVQYCYIHNTGNCSFLLRNATGITLEYNYVRFNNYTSANHCEAISSAEANNNFTVRYNFFEDLYGSAWIYTASGADWPQNTISNWWIYGNVFQISYTNINDTANAIGPSDWGVVALISIACQGEFRFCNNTIVNLNNNSVNSGGGQEFTGIFVGEGYTTTADKFYVQNNVWINCNEVDALPQGKSQVNGSYFAYITNLFWDHNTYISTTVVDPDANKQVLTSNTTNWLANWFSENDRLITNTAAGTTLSAPFNTDPDGNIRGADGAWDRGAYEFNSSLAVSTNPPVISGLQATSVSGRSATIVWVTDKQSTSILQYGLSASYGNTVTNSTLTVSHSIAISNLTASTTYHYLVKSADATGHVGSSSDSTFTTLTSDTTPPTVSLTAPLTNTVVVGTTTLAANATDNVMVAGVQFLVDGQPVGSLITSAPYSFSWNSISVANGAHAIQAMATDISGNTATSAVVNVQVQNIVPNGLVGYWNFDEGSGTQAADSSGFGGTATLNTGAMWTTNAVLGASALLLNAASASSASIPDSTSLEVSGNLTIAMWVKPSSLPTTNSWMYYLDKGQNNQENYAFGAYSDAGGTRLFFEFIDATGTVRYYTQGTGLTLGAGTWTHVAVVLNNAAGQLYFFMKGRQMSSMAVAQSLTVAANPLVIGQQNIAGYEYYLDGCIDDLRIYNRALKASEINALSLVTSFALPIPTGVNANP
jgi:hypothetical protein